MRPTYEEYQIWFKKYFQFGPIFWAWVWWKTFLGPTNVGYRFLFLKYNPIFFVFNLTTFGAFLYLLITSGEYLGLDSGSKTFFVPTYANYQLWQYSPTFLFLIWSHLESFLTFFGSFRAVFGPWGSLFWLESGSKTFFTTY